MVYRSHPYKFRSMRIALNKKKWPKMVIEIIFTENILFIESDTASNELCEGNLYIVK